MRWTAVSMCQPHPAAANIAVTGGENPPNERLDDRLRRHRRVQIDRDIERFGALQDRPEELVVQIAAARVAVDERALEALLPDPALQFFGRLFGRRDRQGGKAGEARRMFLHRFGEEIVGFARDRDLLRRFRLLDPGRIQREHLHVDAGGVHVRDALVADILKLLENLRAAGAPIAEPLGEFLAGPAINPGLTKCSSRVMVRISLPHAICRFLISRISCD